MCGLPLPAPRHTLDNLLELLDSDSGRQALAPRLALHYQLGGQALGEGEVRKQ